MGPKQYVRSGIKETYQSAGRGKELAPVGPRQLPESRGTTRIYPNAVPQRGAPLMLHSAPQCRGFGAGSRTAACQPISTAIGVTFHAQSLSRA